MEIEALTRNNEDEWNDFCKKSSGAWFRHTTWWQKYILCCREDSDSENLSFLIRQDGAIIAVVPLISQYIFSDRNNHEFANYDTPCPILAIKDGLSVKQRGAVMDAANEHIDEIAKGKNVSFGRFFVDPLIDASPYENFDDCDLLKYEYIPSLKTTTIIDLTVGKDIVLQKMRKGHKAAVKAVYRDGGFRVDIFDKDNYGDYQSSMGIMQNIHFIDAGRKTRTDQSWETTYEWIKAGYGFLVMLFDEKSNEYVASAWFMTYKQKAYYGSYAITDSSLLQGRAGYAIQWAAIEYLVDHGYQSYETGWNFYSSYKDEVDDKVLMISRFKHGFGGKRYPLFSFEKQY